MNLALKARHLVSLIPSARFNVASSGELRSSSERRAEPADRLLFDMALFDGAGPYSSEPLQLEQFLSEVCFQLFQCLHALLPSGAEAEHPLLLSTALCPDHQDRDASIYSTAPVSDAQETKFRIRCDSDRWNRCKF